MDYRKKRSLQAFIDLDTVASYAHEIMELGQQFKSDILLPLKVELPGLSLDVQIADSALAEAIKSTFVQTQNLPNNLKRRSIEIIILHSLMPNVPAPLPWANSPYYPQELSTKLAQTGLHGTLYNTEQLWQPQSEAAAFGIQLMRGPTAYPPWELGAPLRVFLHWHYANRGMRLVHAGTLAQNGKGLLLAGAGGAGKSGTVVAGLLNGMQSVGDDYVLIDQSDSVKSFPLYSTLKQDPAGFKRMNLADHIEVPCLNWQGKYEFKISDISSEPIPYAIELKAIAIPRVGASVTTFRPATAREAILALAPSALHQMPGERESGFRFFSNLVRNLPAYILDLGPDPSEISDTVRTFIEDSSR